jgi:phasin
MSESTQKVAADKARDTYRKTTAPLDEFATTQMPEAMRAIAERNITQMRELYERSKDALDAVLQSWERTFGAAGQGAVAFNRKVINITQRNINSGFNLTKSLVGAKNLSEAMEMQAAYWREQFDALGAQAEEVRALSSHVTADMAKPINEQVRRSMGEPNKTS